MTVLVLVLIIKIQVSFNPSQVYSTKGSNKIVKVIKLLNKMSLSSFRKQIRTILIDGLTAFRACVKLKRLVSAWLMVWMIFFPEVS